MRAVVHERAVEEQPAAIAQSAALVFLAVFGVIAAFKFRPGLRLSV